MIIIEWGPPWVKPGKAISTIGGKKYKRFWFWFIAITWTQFNQKEMHDYIAEGNTTWLGAGQ